MKDCNLPNLILPVTNKQFSESRLPVANKQFSQNMNLSNITFVSCLKLFS